MGKSNEAIFSNHPLGRVSAPHHIPPSFSQKRINASYDPTIKLIEEQSHMGFAIEVPPTPDHRVDLIDQLLKLNRRFSACKLSDLIPKPLHRFLSRNGI